jgi:DNA invertase Pin-like site-specific DNA recombinase
VTPKSKPHPVSPRKHQKGRPKLKGGIPLDELLAAHASGLSARTAKDPKLEQLVKRHGRDVFAASQLAPTSANSSKPPKRNAKKAPRRSDDPKAVETTTPRLVGYARVSTDEQTTALQAEAMARAEIDHLFEEQASGATQARPVLAEALASLKAGDTLVVWRLDRLGRSLGHLIEIAKVLRDRGVFLRSLTEGFDTSTASGRLLYHVLGAVAEFEREVIKERTLAGMKAAKKRGTHLGRPNVLAGSRREHALKLLAEGHSQIQVARIMRVSRTTIQRAVAA